MKLNRSIIKALKMVKFAEECPDALEKAICRKSNENPDFVQSLFNFYDTESVEALAKTMIIHYRDQRIKDARHSTI